MYCWKCGDENPDEYRFCGACGAPREETSSFESDAGSVVDNFTNALNSLAESDATHASRATFVATTRIGRQFTTTDRNGKREIVYVDSQGRRKTYASIDDLPPEMRRTYEAMMRGGFQGDIESPVRNLTREVFDGRRSRDGFDAQQAVNRAIMDEVAFQRRRRKRAPAFAMFFIGVFILYLLARLWG
ncbi:MAG: zinc ribbon domain-containing protein [Phycisphaerales bacterium]|nr:zinc ribbon domain-containing protein [Phycisphaerales bacterium]MCB9862759.1 zinc ribbon domain-containing protein [Phycisphaerales bacterium]